MSKNRSLNYQSQLNKSAHLKVKGLNDYVVTKCFFNDIKNELRNENDVIKIELMGPCTNMWVISVQEHLKKYEKNLNFQMQMVEKLKKTNSDIPEKNQIIVAQWSQDRKYYRGKIVDINHQLKQVKIYFIDYGNETIEAFQNIYGLPFFATKIPALAKRIILEDVPSLPTNTIIQQR